MIGEGVLRPKRLLKDLRKAGVFGSLRRYRGLGGLEHRVSSGGLMVPRLRVWGFQGLGVFGVRVLSSEV
jgi:hypothetical protein